MGSQALVHDSFAACGQPHALFTYTLQNLLALTAYLPAALTKGSVANRSTCSLNDHYPATVQDVGDGMDRTTLLICTAIVAC